jgi:extracellular elastinolytic metalloproteinase
MPIAHIPVSNRLTGGPSNGGCLDGTESGGMGEGWSDFMAVASHIKPTQDRTLDYGMSPWVLNNTIGIRKYPYSTNMTTNPLLWSAVNDNEWVHDIGTVWCTMLYEMTWNLIDKHGITDDDLPELDLRGAPTDGRYLAMKLVMGGMALQPCNPNLINARDAILDADKALTAGSNSCEIWRAFAKRGLGEKAVQSETKRVDEFTVPEACRT